jgi:cobyrinic acid a,c-diamide synthase
MGLFDGLGSGDEGSTAQLARILEAPIFLVLDARGLARSAAALVSGYARFLPDVRLSGVLLNRVSGARHYALLKEAIEKEAGIPCLGFLPAGTEFSLKSRHLGLVPAQEVPDLDRRIEALAQAARNFLDLPALLAAARAAPPLPPAPAPRPRGRRQAGRPVRIGLARDAAFSFYYQDNLDLLAEEGATLVPFSPLTDALLPAGLDGLYLGGGWPETFAPELAGNVSMRAAVAAALEAGLPCYAECGGLVYLAKSISTLTPPSGPAGQGQDSGPYPLAGFFPCRAVMTGSLQDFGYATVRLLRDTLLGPAGAAFRVHEFHYSRLEMENPAKAACDPSGANPESLLFPVYAAAKPGGPTRTGGLALRNTLAMYPHVHFQTCPETARSFIRNCRRIAGSARAFSK